MATELQVILKHSPNPDIAGGYWSQPTDRGRAVKCPVHTLDEAAYVCRQYIDRNGLGGGNWTGGQVFNRAGDQVARVWYNGRVSMGAV